MNNDYRGAGAHLLGLQAMMRIRGGLGSLHNTIGLYIKRVDLHALNTGSTNFICTYPVGYSRFQYDLASFPASTPERYNELNLRGSVNPLLLTIFREMQYYARFTDYASHSNQRCTESEFFATIASFQDRLLQLPRTLDDDLSSCMCFTLLAYLTTMFHLPGRWDRHCYIAERLRSSCWSINIAHRPELSPLIRWVVVICAMSVFTAVVEETWMLQMWQTIGDSLTWEETKEQLERVMWSGAFQDAAGRIAFEHLNMGLKSTT
ncbi:hypothetical protein BJY04DRAFT_224344 [Aspergillus karnatakaensis]|uniref:uncharacterized protein n=1 Tax=Aspergillus karnatakaensis TaxID=1810916 RepID=UPI003CCD1ED6